MREVTRVRDRVNRRLDLIQQQIIENQDAALEQWNHARKLVERREKAQAQSAMDIINAHFSAINDLILDPGLPADLRTDLWTIADLLADIHNLLDPIENDHDRDELLHSMRELREEVLVALDRDIQRLSARG